jgi:16S rRNA (cytosine967-C5)-methyltransferase
MLETRRAAGGDDVLRPLVLEAWYAVDREGKPQHEALRAVFRSAPRLKPAQRERIAHTLDAMQRERRRIFYALERAGLDELPRSRKPEAIYLAARVLSGSMAAATAARECPRIDWESVAAVDRAIALETDPDLRLGLKYAFPELLVSLLRAEVGEACGALLSALNREPHQTLRVNRLKTTREKALRELKTSGAEAFALKRSPDAIGLKRWIDVNALDAFQRGNFEVQDESSQLCTQLVAPPPHGVTVDFCAGAGGKTLGLAALLNGRGRLVACDPYARRLQELRRRARRAGVENLQVLELPDPGQSLRDAPVFRSLMKKADRVLVDVPCSGTGVLARKPELRWRINAEELARLPAQQEAIARRAMELVKPGGRLIYATCSLLRVENEAVIERLLSDERFSLIAPKEIVGGALAAEIAAPDGQFMKLWPHIHKTDGFFAAVLRRKPLK